jgi:hypothetical protein
MRLEPANRRQRARWFAGAAVVAAIGEGEMIDLAAYVASLPP